MLRQYGSTTWARAHARIFFSYSYSADHSRAAQYRFRSCFSRARGPMLSFQPLKNSRKIACHNIFVGSQGTRQPSSLSREDRVLSSFKRIEMSSSTVMIFVALLGGVILQVCLAVTPSCCSLNETELDDMIGLADADLSFDDTSLSNKCDDCPMGTCRVTATPTLCYTPEDFLSNNVIKQNYCTDSFGVGYPTSLGVEDKDIRSCVGTTQGGLPPSFDDLAYTPSCCTLSEEDLDNMRGTADGCPPTRGGLRTDILSNKCEKCPPGMCRAGGRYCYCPGFSTPRLCEVAVVKTLVSRIRPVLVWRTSSSARVVSRIHEDKRHHLLPLALRRRYLHLQRIICRRHLLFRRPIIQRKTRSKQGLRTPQPKLLASLEVL